MIVNDRANLPVGIAVLFMLVIGLAGWLIGLWMAPYLAPEPPPIAIPTAEPTAQAVAPEFPNLTECEDDYWFKSQTLLTLTASIIRTQPFEEMDREWLAEGLDTANTLFDWGRVCFHGKFEGLFRDQGWWPQDMEPEQQIIPFPEANANPP